jgi:hypothetical protein
MMRVLYWLLAPRMSYHQKRGLKMPRREKNLDKLEINQKFGQFNVSRELLRTATKTWCLTEHR